jgi:glucokinase
MATHVVGFDIGGTKCAVVLGRAGEGCVRILDRVAFPTETSRGPERALGRLERETRGVLSKHQLKTADVRGIGISCGGPLDSAHGLILSPPNLPGWDRISINERFNKAFGVPVHLQNDANACAFAEWKWGAGRGTRHMVFLTFGTGMGAGLIMNGQLYSGACDLGGEVGHMRLAEDGPLGYGKKGSFEGFCSGGGLAHLARQQIRDAWANGRTTIICADEKGLEGVTALQVASAARQGDAVALETMETCARYLGRGLAILIDVLNPEAIVIGSIFARQRELLWPTAERIIREEALGLAVGACRVVPAELGEAIGDYACLSVAEGA